MATENDQTTVKHVIDKNQYNYIKEKLWGFIENGYLTDVKIITDKDVNYEKKVHGIILQCFCKVSYWENETENGCNMEKTLLLHYGVDLIECIINLLYFGKCIVPVTTLPQFMELANSLMIEKISVYDERGSDYFVYLMHHKQKLINYLCFIKKKIISCDMSIVSEEFKCIPVHRSILSVYSKKFSHCYRNRIKETNPVLLYLPLNGEKIGLTLELCYFGQVTFDKSSSNKLSEVAALLGMERFLKLCNFTRKKCTLNIERSDFRLVKPPINSKPEIINLIKQNNPEYYVYIWTANKCYVFPLLCIQLLNFLEKYDELKETQFDLIVFLKNIHNSIIKKFISCLYNWEYKDEIKILIDLFGLNWPKIKNDALVSKYHMAIANDITSTTMYANNLDDLRVMCEKVFEEECGKGEKIVQLFTCQTCGEQFLSWMAYKYHCKEHLSRGYLCEQCGKFIRPNTFSDHLARHKSLRNYECRHCKKQFPNAYSLKRHQQSSCILEKCPKCKKRVKKLNLKQHIAKHSYAFQCAYCHQNFTSIQWLKRHLIKQTFKKPLKCAQCKTIFDYKCHLKEHIHKTHMSNKCLVCFESFKSNGMLNKHFMIKHTKNQIKCSVCNKVFTRFTSLKVHERFHSGEEPLKCRYCYETFRRWDAMLYHIQNLHEKKKYVCPTCKKEYTSKSYFIEHGWINHQESFDPDLYIVKEGENPPVAFYDESVEASHSFNKKIDLENDVDYRTWFANENMLTYDCPVCRAAFKDFPDLILHLDTHLGE